MHARGLNYWIAFADIAFMLFILVLVAAAREKARAGPLAAENGDLKVKNQRLTVANQRLATSKARLEDLLRKSLGCGNAEAMLSGFQRCVNDRFGSQGISRPGPCQVTVGEDLILFRPGESNPEDPGRAGGVMDCLRVAAVGFAADSPEEFARIKNIHIDGFTDCVGPWMENAALGSRRANALYQVLFMGLLREPAQPAIARVVDKLAVRSFGESRPVDGSRCTEGRGWKPDRRVTVSIEMMPTQMTGESRP